MNVMLRLEKMRKAHLDEWLHYSNVARLADRQAGGEDGNPDQFESNVLVQARGDYGNYMEKASRLRSRLQRKSRSAESRLARLDPEGARARRADVRSAVGNRDLRVHLRYVYLPLMIFLALMEVPINRFAFELYFAETPGISLFIAMGIGIALVFLAHIIGVSLTRIYGQFVRKDGSIAEGLAYSAGVAFPVALVVAMIAFIAKLRQHYIQFIESQGRTFEDFFGEEGGVVEAAQQALSTDLGTEGWMLLVVNLLVLGIGVFAAILRHDAHPDYESVEKTLRKAARRQRKVDDLAAETHEFDEHYAQHRKSVAATVVNRVAEYQDAVGAHSSFEAKDHSDVEAELRRIEESFLGQGQAPSESPAPAAPPVARIHRESAKLEVR